MKIMVEYDTKTKQLSVTKNGEVVENLESVRFYNYGPDYDSGEVKNYMEMRTFERYKDESITEMETTIAKLLGYDNGN